MWKNQSSAAEKQVLLQRKSNFTTIHAQGEFCTNCQRGKKIKHSKKWQ
jgi:hypothetical protein